MLELECSRGGRRNMGHVVIRNNTNPSLLGRWRSQRERTQNANTFVGAVFS